MKKQYRKAKFIISRFFFLSIVLVLIANVLSPDQKTSDLENRSLAQFPDSLSENTFKNLETYYSDQFIGRNALIHLNYLTQKVSGVREIQGVYLGKGQLIEKTASENKKQLKRNLNAINSFQKKNKDCTTQFMLVPNAVSIQSDHLPAFVSDDIQNQQMDEIQKSLNGNIQQLDARKQLSQHSDEYIYYKSDHHWTSLGAYYGAQLVNNDVNMNNYDSYAVSNDFQGTLASKTGSMNIKDEIDIYPPKNLDYIVTYGAEAKTLRSIYRSKGLKQKDQYQVFFGGNEGLINISINNDSDKRLLLIKDSYANALVQFLLPYYRTITIIDPRYYFDDIDQEIDKDLITDILFVYNCNTFVQDTSLADCIN